MPRMIAAIFAGEEDEPIIKNLIQTNHNHLKKNPEL